MLQPDQLGEVLAQLLARGFQPPIYFSAISANGSFVSGIYGQEAPEELDCNLVAQHAPSGAFQYPINIMFCDGRSEAARITIDSSGRETFH